MKKHSLLPVLALFFLGVILSCNHDDDNKTTDPISQLPAATQTGAGTFGCLINGQAFVHNDGIINCFYQFIDGEYNFGIQGKNSNDNPSSIFIGTNSRTISEGETILLSDNSPGNASGGAFFRILNGETSETNENFSGQLIITKFNTQTRIVSATFWFNIQHPVTGERVEVCEGRFDCLFGT